MKEVAKVIKTDKDLAVVYVEKKDECSKCGMCLFPANAKGLEINAKNPINAKTDDTVLIEMGEKGKLLGVFLAFIVPLLLIGLSFVINAFTLKNEIFTLILAVGLVIVWYFILPFFDRKIKNKDNYCAEIISVINNNKN